MQQTCSSCGYVSETTAKFCRQCGAALALPSDESSPSSEAATRQYGRQTPSPAPAAPRSSPFISPSPQPPPSFAEAFGTETARMPGQAQAPPGAPMSYGRPVGPPINPVYSAPKSNWWKWLLGFVAISLLVCGGLGYYALRSAAEFGRRVAQEAEKAANVPAVPGALSLEQLKYPNAKSFKTVAVFGQEILTMTTADGFDQVKTFYEQQLGQANLKVDEASRRTLVFQQTPFMVTIKPSERDADELQIVVIRSTLIPNITVEEKKN
jgi:hypothetical protein